MIGTDAGLSWSRLQQSAFLFTSWAILYDRINNQQSSWTEDLRSANGADESDTSSLDPAFVGTHSLLATDQGIRGFQFILNDFCYLNSAELDLHKWKDTFDFEDVTPEAVRTVAETLHVEPAYEFLQALCEGLASFDWRTSSAPDLNEGDRLFKAALRGSGGYQELRRRLVQHLTSNSNNSTIVATAKRLAGVLAS
jgi:hypothetical protein